MDLNSYNSKMPAFKQTPKDRIKSRPAQQCFFDDARSIPYSRFTEPTPRRPPKDPPPDPRGQLLMFAPFTAGDTEGSTPARPKHRLGDWYRIHDSVASFALRDAEVTIILIGASVLGASRKWGTTSIRLLTNNFTHTSKRGYETARRQAEKTYGLAIHKLTAHLARESADSSSAERRPTHQQKTAQITESPRRIPIHYRMDGPYIVF